MENMTWYCTDIYEKVFGVAPNWKYFRRFELNSINKPPMFVCSGRLENFTREQARR